MVLVLLIFNLTTFACTPINIMFNYIPLGLKRSIRHAYNRSMFVIMCIDMDPEDTNLVLIAYDSIFVHN